MRVGTVEAAPAGESATAALGVLETLAILALVLPNFTLALGLLPVAVVLMAETLADPVAIGIKALYVA